MSPVPGFVTLMPYASATYTYMYVCVCVHRYMYVYIYLYINSMYVYIHTYMYTHTHTQVRDLDACFVWADVGICSVHGRAGCRTEESGSS